MQRKTCRLPLLLLTLLTSCCAVSSVTIHDAAVSIKSVGSVIYRDTQISLFRTDGHQNRLFHQPLSFLDTNTLKVRKLDGRWRIHLDVFLWTNEFLKQVREKYEYNMTVELMPITHLQLSWSPSASEWLGRNFSASYRLVGQWRDGDRPRMRQHFTIECQGLKSCRNLLRKLNDTDGTGSQLLDLKYRVRGDRSENLLLQVRPHHLLQTETYKRLSRFSKTVPGGQIIVPEWTVSALVRETLTSSLLSRQSETGTEIARIDSRSQEGIEQQLSDVFRADVKRSTSNAEWAHQVFWPVERVSVRPDKLAMALNHLFTPVSGSKVRLSDRWEANLEEVKSSSTPDIFTRIKNFMHAYRPLPGRNISLDVEEVVQLAESLDSSVKWDIGSQRFLPSTLGLMYQLDMEELQSRPSLAIQQAEISFRHADHSDPVAPVAFDATLVASAEPDCRESESPMARQLQQLRRNFTVAIESIEARLNSWMNQLAPLRSAGVPDAPEESSTLKVELNRLNREINSLKSKLPVQSYFADSCVLANTRDPAGMNCQTIGFRIPPKSLRFFPRSEVYAMKGRVGASRFIQSSGDRWTRPSFFEWQLRICCTAA